MTATDTDTADKPLIMALSRSLIKKIDELSIDGLYGEDYIDLDNHTSITLSRVEEADSPKYISIIGSLTHSDKINNRTFVREIMTCNEDIKLGFDAHYYDENKDSINERIIDGYKSVIWNIMWSLSGILEMGESRLKDIIDKGVN